MIDKPLENINAKALIKVNNGEPFNLKKQVKEVEQRRDKLQKMCDKLEEDIIYLKIYRHYMTLLPFGSSYEKKAAPEKLESELLSFRQEISSTNVNDPEFVAKIEKNIQVTREHVHELRENVNYVVQATASLKQLVSKLRETVVQEYFHGEYRENFLGKGISFHQGRTKSGIFYLFDSRPKEVSNSLEILKTKYLRQKEFQDHKQKINQDLELLRATEEEVQKSRAAFANATEEQKTSFQEFNKKYENKIASSLTSLRENVEKLSKYPPVSWERGAAGLVAQFYMKAMNMSNQLDVENMRDPLEAIHTQFETLSASFEARQKDFVEQRKLFFQRDLKSEDKYDQEVADVITDIKKLISKIDRFRSDYVDTEFDELILNEAASFAKDLVEGKIQPKKQQKAMDSMGMSLQDFSTGLSDYSASLQRISCGTLSRGPLNLMGMTDELKALFKNAQEVYEQVRRL